MGQFSVSGNIMSYYEEKTDDKFEYRHHFGRLHVRWPEEDGEFYIGTMSRGYDEIPGWPGVNQNSWREYRGVSLKGAHEVGASAKEVSMLKKYARSIGYPLE